MNKSILTAVAFTLMAGPVYAKNHKNTPVPPKKPVEASKTVTPPPAPAPVQTLPQAPGTPNPGRGEGYTPSTVAPVQKSWWDGFKDQMGKWWSK